tara:strand:+ start:107 stop:1228 length:1122 start_codon:yes stop_codon:yes gene_type:complete
MTTKHMGNLLVALHSIAALASTHSNTLVIVDEAYKDIVESVPGIDNVLYYPRGWFRKKGLFGRLKLLRRFVWTLRAHRANLLLNFDAKGLATFVAMIPRAKTRWGLVNSAYKSFYDRIVARNERPHRYYHYAQLVTELLGTCDKSRYPQLTISTRHQQSLDRTLAAHQVKPAQPYICIHAGATKAYKQWPVTKFAHTADWLAEQGFQVVFIGAGAGDSAIIDDVLNQSAKPHINLCDKLNLGELMALFSTCAFFLGNDSGPMHLATATGAPVFALFGPTDVQRWGPLGKRATIIRDPEPCTPECSKKFCPQDFRCLKLLDESVIRNVLAQHLVKLTQTTRSDMDRDVSADVSAGISDATRPRTRNSRASVGKP